MGKTVSKTTESLSLRKKRTVLMLGLDGTGKTTMLYNLRGGSDVATSCFGFHPETLQLKQMKLLSWNLEGSDDIRSAWKQYYPGAQGIIFVIDACDKEKIPIAVQELTSLLEVGELKSIPLLVLANKRDLEGSLDPATLVDLLDLTKIMTRHWNLQATCAIDMKGVDEGLQWLTEAMERK